MVKRKKYEKKHGDREQMLTVMGKEAYKKLKKSLQEEGIKFTSTRKGSIYRIYPKEESIRKGKRVVTTGYGRTKNWGKYTGIVSKRRGNSIFVYWDGTHFEDEMNIKEVKLI